MLCEKCNKNNASFFYDENINGKKRSLALCDACAANLKASGELPLGDGILSFSHGTSLSSLSDSLFGTHFAPYEKPHSENAPKRCPFCGSTIYDLKKSGKVGCGECYKTFSSELGRTIHQIHGNSNHVGKAPVNFREKHQKASELEGLKKKLKDAIAEENFEDAALLRDKIRKLESEK